MANHLFGYLPDGTPIEEYELHSDKLSVSILTLGGILRTLKVNGRDVIGGYDTLEAYLYEAGGSYQGAIIGRVGNRIANGRFRQNGKLYRLAKNNGRHHLHGGLVGFNLRVWTVEEADDSHLTLSLFSPDGEEGYPSNLFVKVTYSVEGDALMLAYNATSDGDTPINLTNHTYFNLGGLASGDVLDYVAQTHADTYTEVDGGLIPTGNHPSVAGTPFDFRTPKAIGADLGEALEGYDHNFIFAGAPMGEICGTALPHVATVTGKDMALEVYTDAPCAQFYTANFLFGLPDFKGGVKREKRHAFCFETQREPDGVNHGAEPLHAGELFHTVTVYRFV
jgi:aldose 1-epimerase